MNPHRDAELCPRPLGEAYMVEVSVRENERLYVPGRTTETPKSIQQSLPGGRQASIDHGKVAVFLYQIPVDEVLADTMDTCDDVAV